jgi:hypothetical protein
MQCSKISRRQTECGLFSLMAMEKPQAGRSQLGINKYYFQLNPSLRSAVCIFAAESVAAKRGLHLLSGIRR